MVPITDSGTTRRRLVDRLAIGILIGVVAVSVGGAALLTVYLNRIGDAVEGLHRVDGLGAYEGRPEPVVVDGVSAVNYLLLTVDDQNGLQAVVIAHLSATRRDLTLIALPSNLVVDDGTGAVTLGATYRADPLWTARAVENLTGARMDHQVQLGLDGFAGVVDVLGGVDLGQGNERLDGSQVVAMLAASKDPAARSERTVTMLRAALVRANLGAAIADPNRFDQVMNALTPCLTVDSALTGEEIRATMMESRVRTDQVNTWTLQGSAAGAGTHANSTELQWLRSSMAADAFPATVPMASSPPTAATGVAATGSAMPTTTPSGATPIPAQTEPVVTGGSGPSGPPGPGSPSPSATR